MLGSFFVSFVFTVCSLLAAGCTVAKPIKTNSTPLCIVEELDQPIWRMERRKK
jgi:hypothetical protein